MNQHHKINYIEFAAKNLESTESFFKKAFSSQFTHYGPDYMDCNHGGLMVGFYRSDLKSVQATGGAMLTFYSDDLEASLTLIESLGCNITKEIFSFPGGRRFQFAEPSGNELAIWSLAE